MAQAFRSHPDGHLTAQLEPQEADLLRYLIGDVIELVAVPAPATGVEPEDAFAALVERLHMQSIDPPSDPAARRLLPDASHDPELAAEFRTYTEHDLRQLRHERRLRVLASLEDTSPLRLSVHHAQEWAQVLADIRLVLGTRLGVSHDDDDDADNESTVAHDVYDWLTWLQDSLVRALMASAVEATS